MTTRLLAASNILDNRSSILQSFLLFFWIVNAPYLLKTSLIGWMSTYSNLYKQRAFLCTYDNLQFVHL